MKYCYACNRITVGEPLFCNFCGRSYNVKLCPRMHANSRRAQACSQCGSRDLSTPGPQIPFWVPILEVVLSLIPGLVLVAVSIGAVWFVISTLLQSTDALLDVTLLLAALGFLWWL